MFALTAENTFHLYSHPTDMRKSFDSLSGLVRNNLGNNPTGGEVFIFINRRRDKIKLLHWQGSGYLLYYKKLDSGRFRLPEYDPSTGSMTIKWSDLVLIVKSVKPRKPKLKTY
ncbi:MAG: IS66 family insertion sequence element accessory protein TnpB [Bacteroidota bacterium]